MSSKLEGKLTFEMKLFFAFLGTSLSGLRWLCCGIVVNVVIWQILRISK